MVAAENKTLADAVRQYPRTFEAMATLPMQDVTLRSPN
jgi:hypothetical protein